MMENGVDPDESFNFIAKLFDQLLSDTDTKATRKNPRRIVSDESSYMLCKVVNHEYGARAKRNLLAGEDVPHLRLLPQLFENYLRMHPHALPPDVVLWTITKILAFLSSPIIFETLGGLYQEHVIALCKALPIESKNYLLREAFNTLCETVKGIPNVCFHTCEAGEANAKEVKCSKGSIKLNSVIVDVSGLLDNRSLLQRCIVDLIQHGEFDLTYLNECNMLHIAWRALIPLVETCSFSLKNKCLLVLQRLVSLDLCNRAMADALVKRLLAIEIRLGEMQIHDEDIMRLEEALATCQQTFTNCLRKFKTQRTFENLELGDVIEWLSLLIDTIRKQSIPKDRLISFLSVLCSMLSRLKDPDERFINDMKSMAEGVTVIVQTIVVRGVETSLSQLGDLLSFMFTVDKWTESSDSGQEVVRIVRDAKEKFVGKEVVHTIRIEHMIISAVKKSRNGEMVLAQIIPTGEELLQVLKTVATLRSGGEDILSPLIALISTLIDCGDKDQVNWIAFLSMPWLTESIDYARHQRSIPLLAEIRRLAVASKKACTLEVKCSTIPAIARMQCASEWRRIIFTRALESPDVKLQQTALEHFASFVHSINVHAFSNLLDRILFLANLAIQRLNGAVICATVLKAVANALCTLDTKVMPSEGEVCAVCSQSVVTSQKMKLDLAKLFHLFERVMRNEDKELRLACCAVLQSALKHVQFQSRDILESTVNKSLALMGDLDEDVRADYEWVLIQIVQMPWNDLYRNISIKLSDLEEEGKQSALLQYTLACAQYSVNADLAHNCFVKIVLLAVRSACPDAVLTARTLIQTEVAKHNPKIEPEQLFLRQKSYICKYLAKNLVNVTFFDDRQSDSQSKGGILRRVKEQADEAFTTMSELFGYMGDDGWLSAASDDLVPSLILSHDAPSGVVEAVLDKILEMRRLSANALITECFPSLLIHLIALKDDANITKSAFRFIEHYTKNQSTWMDLMSTKMYNCIVILLQHLSVSEKRCIEYLIRLHKIGNGENAPFTLTAFVEQRYLGILLHFRPAFTDEYFYSERAVIASSLCRMMRKIYEEGTNFLDTTATKMLAVLRVLTPLGEISIAPWRCFVETLSDEALLGILPQILVSIGPLLQFDGARSLLSFIFKTKRLQLSANLEFERISLMLWNNPKVQLNEFLSSEHQCDPMSKVLIACASLLKESNEEVSELVLHKVFNVLDGASWDDDATFDSIAAQLVPSLLHTIRSSESAECRRLASLVFGRLGAIDPGRIGLSSSNSSVQIDRRSTNFVFVDSGDAFYLSLIERASVAFSGIVNAAAQELCSYSIQMVLRELVVNNGEEGNTLWTSLSERCRKELHMLKATSFTRNEPLNPPTSNRPLVSHATGYMPWMSLWYVVAAKKIRDGRLKTLFDSLGGLVESDAVFARFILPQLVLQGIIEQNMQLINECESEMKAVLQRALIEDGWPRLAAHVIFSIIDCLERYAEHRIALNISSDIALDRTRELLSGVMNERLSDGTLVAVVAAQKCHCAARALRWCEQYAIGIDGGDRNEFAKAQYHSLQRIYAELDDKDGILGSFETMKLYSKPSMNDIIFALEANGDYADSLPLYKPEHSEQKVPLIECLLCLNQPFVAFNAAEAMLKTEQDPAVLEGIQAAEIEAAWHLHDWSLLDKMVEKHPSTSSWGATNASIICAIKHKDETSINSRIYNARNRLVDSLTAMTIDDSDTYAQAYKYITQLHIVAEMEEAKDSLCSSKGEELTPQRLISVLGKWQKRSACVMQCSSVLEPIFQVRRGLLRITDSTLTRPPICDLFLQSCRMSRLAGHLQIAWSYLAEAKALDVNHFEVAMEEATFLFEKGNQTQAIDILRTLLAQRFSSKVKQLENVIEERKKQSPINTTQLKASLRNESKEDMDNFVKVQLLLADYCLRAGRRGLSEMYSVYNSLPLMADPSEDLYYRVAIFLDNYLYSKNESVLEDKVTLILQAYIRVLTQGRTHLFHVMPRMLTIWLDTTQKKAEESIAKKSTSSVGISSANKTINSDDKDIREMNTLMREAFARLDHHVFYTAFAQLISRITHPNEEVFNTLKNILAELLVDYPHQCLWQSIAVYRSDPKKQDLRFSRCRTVYDVAKRRDSSGQLKTLISQYEYAAAAFIKVAEDSYPAGTHSPFSQRYAYLANFFKTGEMDQSVKISSNYESCASRPLVVVPLREMIEPALPVAIPNSLSQFPVGQTPPQEMNTNDSTFSNIYIHSIDEQFMVMKSLVRPKKITLVASDGKRYALMCKAKDELRKDGRLMDINRMVNALLHQNADSRRRQLSVRTYNVVPLQDAGGLIEWIPNLETYRKVLEPLMAEKNADVMSDKEWFTNWIPHGTDKQKYERLVNLYYAKHPLVMADWFRRNFADPCKWYGARLAFTHTSAVMSMVGFVLGLGDRHGENMLIDITNGDAIHVDFNLLFNKGENLAVPEVVPFRLTRNIINGFGVTGVKGAFTRSCETTMRVLRENEAVLHTVLQTFVHDPLLEWMHSEVRAQQLKQQQIAKGINAKPCNSRAQQQAQEAIDMISRRLLGSIVTPRIHRSKLDHHPMSVEGQVDKLIQLASDDHNLAKMYIGWCPFM